MIRKMVLIVALMLVPAFSGAELINKYTIAELTPTVAPKKTPKPTRASKKALILETARSLIGVDYWPGGQDLDYGFDCSAMTQYAYSRAGIKIPRRAVDQFHGAVKIEETALQPGDLVFFNTRGYGINHVGIYSGKGRFIHAPGVGKQIAEDSLNRPYWRARFITGGKYL